MSVKLRKSHLKGELTLGNEVLILRIVDGAIVLGHVEADLLDENEQMIGTILFNDEIKLPLSKFTISKI